MRLNRRANLTHHYHLMTIAWKPRDDKRILLKSRGDIARARAELTRTVIQAHSPIPVAQALPADRQVLSRRRHPARVPAGYASKHYHNGAQGQFFHKRNPRFCSVRAEAYSVRVDAS